MLASNSVGEGIGDRSAKALLRESMVIFFVLKQSVCVVRDVLHIRSQLSLLDASGSMIGSTADGFQDTHGTWLCTPPPPPHGRSASPALSGNATYKWCR